MKAVTSIYHHRSLQNYSIFTNTEHQYNLIGSRFALNQLKIYTSHRFFSFLTRRIPSNFYFSFFLLWSQSYIFSAVLKHLKNTRTSLIIVPHFFFFVFSLFSSLSVSVSIIYILFSRNWNSFSELICFFLGLSEGDRKRCDWRLVGLN